MIAVIDYGVGNLFSLTASLNYIGADVTVTNAAQSDSLPIIIATPDSLPELETLFPEDLAWLRAVGKVGDMERWGEDGFAIRQHDGKIYITASGTCFGFLTPEDFAVVPYPAQEGAADAGSKNVSAADAGVGKKPSKAR